MLVRKIVRRRRPGPRSRRRVWILAYMAWSVGLLLLLIGAEAVDLWIWPAVGFAAGGLALVVEATSALLFVVAVLHSGFAVAAVPAFFFVPVDPMVGIGAHLALNVVLPIYAAAIALEEARY